MDRLLGLLLLLAGLAACSGPLAWGSEQRTLVRLYDAKTGVRIELANRSHPEYRDIYSQPRSDASLKLGSDELLERLLERLDELNFGQLSVPGAPPQDAPVLGWLEVVDGDGSRTFAVPKTGATREQIGSFAQMQYAVSEAYTSVTGLQFIDNPSGGDLFRRQPAAGGQP
ncbi:MAG TPA: hypothetical protein VFD43_03750 [Planctomycetota bacterium]|nr:hypothetical protein [Planctomycetota bacterium]